MASLIVTKPSPLFAVTCAKGISTTTRTLRAPIKALIIPTPFAMSTYTPALSPRPGLSQITKVFLDGRMPFAYIESGMGTALMKRVQDLASGLVWKVRCSCANYFVGTRVASELKYSSLS
jgi:hypothetical protein